MRNGVIAALLVAAIIVGAGAGYLLGNVNERTTTTTRLEYSTANSESVTTVGSETFVDFHTTLASCPTCHTTIGATKFTYTLSVNYSGGPWMLHYWVQNFTGTQSSINGNLIGSGNHSEIWISFYVAGYAQYTLCASATKLPNDSPQRYDLPLTLSLIDKTDTAANSDSTAEVCGTLAV